MDALVVHILHREDRLPQAKVQSFIAFAAPRLGRTQWPAFVHRNAARSVSADLPKGGASC